MDLPPTKTLPSQRHLFDIPDGVTFLNAAYMTPQLRAVSEAGAKSVRRKATPWTLSPQDFFTDAERLRALAGELVGADAEAMALVPSASYGIAIAAANIPVARGQSIVLLHEQFPSHVYAWREVASAAGARIHTVHREAGSGWTDSVLDAIDDDTAVVAVPHCHWTDGSLVDLERVGQRARQAGAALVIDATQSLGAHPLDVTKVQPDFLVAAGYKWLLGPYSLGYLYVAPQWRERGIPLEYGWINKAGSEDFAGLVQYVDDYRAGARRFDMGENANFVLVPMALAALRQILDWGVDTVAHSLRATTNEIARRASALGFVALPAEQRASHLIGLRLPASSSSGLPAGIGERLAARQIYVSIRGDSIRVGPHLYNTPDDVERLFDALSGEVK